MAKQIQGSCNRCGHCGCYAGAGGPAKWYPGIGAGSMRMRYYEDHPQLQPIIFQLIKDEFADQYGRPWEHSDKEFVLTNFQIKGGGPTITVDLYVSEKGVHVSPTDFSCPWLKSTLNATITSTIFTASPDTVSGSSTSGSVVGNLAIASGGSVGIISNVAANTLTVHSWVGGIPLDGESVEVRENECRLWGRSQLPPACANYPQMFQYVLGGEKMIAAWEENHRYTGAVPPGLCGYHWEEV